MKVLMFGWEFPPFNSGGLGTACYGLTKSLNRNNVSLTFVLPRKIDVDVDFLKFIFGDDTLKIKTQYIFNSLLKPYSTEDSYSSSLFSDEKNFKNNIYGSNLFEEVERYGEVGGKIASMENFDIIHAHDWLTFKAAIAAKKVSGKYLVVHIHATEFDRTGGNGVNQYVYDIEKKGMEEADAVVAVSNYTKQKIIEHYGIPAEKIKVVHNGVEFENYALEKMHELKKTKKIVLFLGRLTLQKGPDYFVYAAKKVLDFYPDVVFVVAGSGDMEKAIIRKVADLGIADKFIFTGFLRGDDIKEAYHMADLYVLPSVSEPFGITPLEALMCGTPVLVSKQSGVSEVLSNCLKTDFWDVDDIANKIVSVLKHDELQRCLRENGSEEVKKINWDKPAKRCVEIYDELLRGKK
jgi:glycosyltransferase involved in cell wall biosynthesis